jgi:hypothetical protein
MQINTCICAPDRAPCPRAYRSIFDKIYALHCCFNCFTSDRLIHRLLETLFHSCVMLDPVLMPRPPYSDHRTTEDDPFLPPFLSRRRSNSCLGARSSRCMGFESLSRTLYRRAGSNSCRFVECHSRSQDVLSSTKSFELEVGVSSPIFSIGTGARGQRGIRSSGAFIVRYDRKK